MKSEFTLTLTSQELDHIGSCLAERPYKEVNGLMAKINNQLVHQQEEKSPPENL